MAKITQPENSPIEFDLFNRLRFALETAAHALDMDTAGHPVSKGNQIPRDLIGVLSTFRLDLRQKIAEVQLALASGEDLPAELMSALADYEKAEQERIKDEILLPKKVAEGSAAGHPKKRGARKVSAFQYAAEKFPGTSESDAERKYLAAKKKAAQREKARVNSFAGRPPPEIDLKAR